MANPAPTINQINAFNATQGTTIDFNIIGGTELVRSNRIYIYDLSDNSLICTHLYVSTESIHELPANTDGSIVYESGKSSADFVNGAQYYAQIQTFTDIAGTEGDSGLSVAKMFWCLNDPTLTIDTIPSTISTTSYNISATYNANTSVVSNIIQQYQFSLYSATGSLLQSSGVVVGSGTQQGTSTAYDISYNFTGLSAGSSYYVAVDVTTTQGMSVSAQSGTFTVSIDTPTLGEATVVNNACDGYISVTSNLSGEYGGSASGEIASFVTDSVNDVSSLKVFLEPIQSGSGTPSPSNVRPISGHDEVGVSVVGKNLFDEANATIYRRYFQDLGSSHVWRSDEGSGSFAFLCKPNTTYTVSCDNPSIALFRVAYIDVDPDALASSDSPTLYGVVKKTESGSITITTGADAKAVVVQVNNAIATARTANLQIELGTTATEYEPYNGQSYHKDIEVTYTPTVQENEPYLFKQTGDVGGDRETVELVGGSVAWNQLLDVSQLTLASNNGITVSKGTNTFTIDGTAGSSSYASLGAKTGIPINVGHIYLFALMGANPPSAAYTTLSINGGYQEPSSPRVIEATTNTFSAYWRVRANESVSNYTFSPCYFDLTAMFGSTIADYIYSLEQGTAGAGVAFFRKYFPKSYYPYDAGTIKSVEGVSAHKTVGFNAWDEEWESGYFDTSGNPVANSSICRSKNFIPVVPNTAYFYKSNGQNHTFVYYDADKNFIRLDTAGGGNSAITTPLNCHYMKFAWVGTTYNNDICINLSWDGERNGEYEPYVEHSYPLDSSLTLRGIPKLDANNNLYYDGDTYESDGTVTRKFGIVDLGSKNWIYSTQYKTFYIANSTNALNQKNITTSDMPNMLLSGFVTVKAKDLLFTMIETDKLVSMYTGGTTWYIDVRDESFNGDTQAFKTAMSGVYLVYELATPTTEQAQPFESIQKVTPNYGTEEFVTNSIVPVGNNTQYYTRDIYGGYIDLVSGELVVTHKMRTFDGSENWGADSESSGVARLYLRNDEIKKVSSTSGDYTDWVKSNRLPSSRNGYTWTDVEYMSITCYSGAQSSADNYFYVMSRYAESGIQTVAQLKTWLSSNPLQFWYPLADPLVYQLTPQQIQTLVGVNNVWSEQGNVELSYHIPITNLLVKRQDVDDVSGSWLTLYSQPITQASDMDFTFIDFTNQYGKTYKYALVPLLTQTQSGVEVEVEGGYTVSDEVQSVFDGVFIVDSTGSQKCKANVGYGNVDMNQTVGTITPIGAKYPIVITNSKNQYHNGSISGTIVPDDYYFNGNLSRIDMVNKRDELEQFLTNKRAKIIKDWNGKIWLVMIMDNVSCTFNNNYGMGIVNFSTNWVEVGDPTNQQDLQATGLINIGGV